MTDEQALLAELRDIADDLDAKKSHWSANRIRDALALLDAQDEENARERELASDQWGHRMAAEVERDEALAKVADLEKKLLVERERADSNWNRADSLSGLLDQHGIAYEWGAPERGNKDAEIARLTANLGGDWFAGTVDSDGNPLTAIRDDELQRLRDERDKFMWQVRDTCTRAEKAERQRDTALSRAERAEQALAEERKAHQAFRDEVSEAVENAETVGDLFHFILPAKPADSLVEAAKAICKEDGQDWDTLEQTYNGRQRQHDYKRFARAAIERAGGTISFEGEG